jgi:predicted PurR-regulated permease PerM
MSENGRRLFPCSGLVIFALTCGILYVAQEVIIPISLAALLALLLVPTVRTLQRRGLGNAPAVLSVMGILSILLVGVLWLIVNQVGSVVADLPKYRANVKARMDMLYHSKAAVLAGSVSQFQESLAGQPEAADPAHPPRATASHDAPPSEKQPAPTAKPDRGFQVGDYLSIFSSAFRPFAMAATVILLCTFILMQREDLYDRFLILTGRITNRDRTPVSANAIDEAFQTISAYLRNQSLSNACMAVVISCGLWLLGVPNAMLWGSIVFVMRFIPYVGITIVAVLTFLFSFATSGDPSTPFLVLGLFACVEFLLGGVVEPVFFSHTNGLSSIAILVAALFWTWLWGIAGLFLSVPLTVCWVLIGRNFDNFDFLDTLLSNRALLPPEKLLFHHLLIENATDFSEALGLQSSSRTFEEVFDEVLVPTMCLVELENQRGRITQERYYAIILNLRLAAEELIDGIAAASAGRPAVLGPANDRPTSRQPARVLCIPAHGEMDDVACAMVAQLLIAKGAQADKAPVNSAPEVEKLITASGADAVCVCALSVDSTMRAIAWSRVLRNRFPDLTIVVGLWNPKAEASSRMEKAKVRYRIEVATGLKEAVMLLAPAAEPVRLLAS